MKNIFLIIITSLLFSGCKATVETEVSLKDMLESKTKNINGDLYVEVATCNSHEDSRKPSSSVIEARKTIPGILVTQNILNAFQKNLTHSRISVFR